ncbi:hypothetical protein LY90DRAFT_663849 [Neocallimastix californiae]|uniref:Dolichyl-phosphate-mannose--protein mannosyltransferase n=1 Tax=Neocallimastix californiae TaxID=1754190 RepID=A0A1Y2FHI4_9FUNG|nr:hypothetical protein LY90DRAFT_663849 [Neocallimastix californiae]|eukprot:ORY83418.1 hypothetical protein LY90DRAFT_663849 [Neocallimastix californiae]
MDILYYTNYDNRNYRQNEYNINQYNIYSQYNNNLKISSYDDDPFYNNAKKERRLSLTNIFSFVINNSKNKENNNTYSKHESYYKKGNKYIVKGFTKRDKIFLFGLSLVSLGLNSFILCHSYDGINNIKKNLYLDNQPYFIKKLLSYSLKDNNNEFIDITDPKTSPPLLQVLQLLVNNILVILTYLSIKNFGNSDLSSFIGGSLVLFNSLFNMNSILNITYSPYLLVLFIEVYFWSKLSYNPEEYKYVLGSAICSGLSLCLSWNGILTYLTGIAISIKNGLDIKGNNKLSNNDISRKMAGSFITFFGLPLVISLCISSVIPSDHSVNNKYMFLKDETNVEAVYNSEVLIRNFAYDGYLGYNDALDINYNNTEIYNSLTIKKNSLWTVVRSDSKFNSEKLKHMFYIRLRNTENKKFVRIDSNKDDNTKRNRNASYNITTGGYLKILDSKEYWKLEIIGIFKSDGVKIGKTKFRLRNAKGNCYLTSEPHSVFINDGVTEPRVICRKSQNEGSVWVFDYAYLNEDNPNYKKEPYTLKNTKGIISNFMYKWKMGTGEYGSYEQNIRPFFWPTLNKLTIMLSNKVEKPHFKLNICSWNIAFAGIVAFPIILFKKILHDKNTASFDIDTIGWIGHYLPYLIFRRMALIQNYAPALYFSILLATSCIEIYLSEVLSNKKRIVITITIVGLCAIFNLIS